MTPLQEGQRSSFRIIRFTKCGANMLVRIFREDTPTGVIGDPTHASAALGEKLLNSTVDAVASILKKSFLI
jgi:creatinine amidohydrolase/Fe(II)-dependent formamide hydrolase-like protein